MYHTFGYHLDNFQNIGIEHIDNGFNLLVSAPTGSGKTLFANYGIYKSLSKSKKIIYTSPIKSLSNQKFYDFSKEFGTDKVGILTGDIKMNPGADILIMTAEILRNSMYSNISTDINFDEIDCIVLDEAHYIFNKDRGTVWEEILLKSNNNIQLIMLSATIEKPQLLINWINSIKSIECKLVIEHKRPVELQHGIWNNNKINYFYVNNKWRDSVFHSTYNEINKHKINKQDDLLQVIDHVCENNMTPANIFIISKKLIYRYSKILTRPLIDKSTMYEIDKIWNNTLRTYKEKYQKTEEWNYIHNLIMKGIGIHHSGLTPILKEITEILYSKNLLKILLSTETFAIGVNMPTKTVIIHDVYKFYNTSQLFTNDEYKQIVGRAGRRGIDTIGYVIILPNNKFPDFDKIKYLMEPSNKTLSSKLSLDMFFILKLLDIYKNKENIIKFIQSSYLYRDIKLNNNRLNEIKNIVPHEIINDFMNIKNNKISGNKLLKIQKKIYKFNNLLEEYYNLGEINKSRDISLHIDQVFGILFNYGFISENNILTKDGKIISAITNCNPISLLEMIKHPLFKTLRFNEIVAMFSIYFFEIKSDDVILISDLNITDNAKEILKHLVETIEKYEQTQSHDDNFLLYPCDINWDINLYPINIIIEWLDKKSWVLLENKDDIYQGDFIKLILRIINLFYNIYGIFENYNMVDIMDEIYNYNEKLLFDIITNDSLYINFLN